MIKRLQNRISESKMALPITTFYGILVWMAAGLFYEGWWIQFALFALSTYLIVELNNSNALIRIYSRMVSCSFIALWSMACFLFGDLKIAVIQTGVIACYSCLFHSYQNKSSGLTYVAALALGLASLIDIQLLFFLPVMWLLMFVYLNALNLRTWCATLLGAITPYWFLAAYAIYNGQLHLLTNPVEQMMTFAPLFQFEHLTLQQAVTIVWTILLALLGILHYLRNSHQDKIRIRQLYGCFIAVNIIAMIVFLLQPTNYTIAQMFLIINGSPLIAHFIALTNSRLTNITSIILVIITLFITAYNLWNSL